MLDRGPIMWRLDRLINFHVQVLEIYLFVPSEYNTGLDGWAFEWGMLFSGFWSCAGWDFVLCRVLGGLWNSASCWVGFGVVQAVRCSFGVVQGWWVGFGVMQGERLSGADCWVGFGVLQTVGWAFEWCRLLGGLWRAADCWVVFGVMQIVGWALDLCRLLDGLWSGAVAFLGDSCICLGG